MAGPKSTVPLRLFMACISLLPLAACYAPDRQRLSAEVNGAVSAGMPLKAASEKLLAIGFDCSGGAPVSCARIRQRLLPSTCVERVNIYKNRDDLVEGVDIPNIVCTGM